MAELGGGEGEGSFQPGKDLNQIAKDGRAEAFFVEKLTAVMTEGADAPVVLPLCLKFDGIENETGVARDFKRVALEIRRVINEHW
ncbi:MAG TPA: hypothetical protein VNN25_26200, partial [Thermoanaerobaculia bacterium]|nr:hypothetical protein [Thermoanaerobaculia bacterium]